MTESDIVRHSAKFERRDGERAWRVLRSFLPLWQQSLLPLWYLITSPGHGTGVRRDRMERNRHERQLTEFVGSHGFLRNSKHGDLVVSCFWSGSRHRAGHDLSSRRLAKGARIGQVDFVRAAFLRGATRGFRHRTLHADEGDRVDRTPVDSVASLLGLLRIRLLYRSRAEPGDEDPGASLGEFARLDVFPFHSPDGRPRLGTQSAGSVWSDVYASGAILQRRG